MSGFDNITRSLLFLIGFDLSAIAQSSIITTYAGLGRVLPAAGTPAVHQPINAPSSVIPDTVGGFYFTSEHRVYRVAADGSLTVIAGNGVLGDGGPALATELRYPSDLALDAAGNLFIADTGNNRVRRVASTGVISTVAGTGFFGFSGDGGLANAAQLHNPSGIALDAAGNLLIADSGNNRIRKVTSEGNITTVAGTGRTGYDGCGLSGDGGEAVFATLCFPTDVAVDPKGNLFIADSNNYRIRKVSSNGVISTVVASLKGPWEYITDGDTAKAQLGYPQTVAVDGAGNLFIGDPANHSVLTFIPDNPLALVAGSGTVGFSGDGGPATAAQLYDPQGVAVDGAGNLFIADSQNARIRKVTPAGIISTVAGTGISGFNGDGGPATAAQLSYAEGVAVDGAGNLFIADSQNARIRKVTPAGIISTVAGTGISGFNGDGGPATAAELSHPVGVAVDGAGNLFIADSSNARIRKVTPAGVITTVAGSGEFGFSGDGGPATAARLSYPRGLAVDAEGNLFFADSGNSLIRKVTPAGVITTVAGTTGMFGFSGDGGPATAAQLYDPQGVAVDGGGNLFIADSGSARIRKVTPDGVITTVAGVATLFTWSDYFDFSGDGGPATAAHLYYPQGVAVDGAGNLFIADTFNYRIRKVTADGIITTVAGGGEFGFSGNGGLATAARLFYPSGVAVDGVGNLFIADTFNHRIRKVTPAGIISTVAGDRIGGFSGDGGPASAARLNGPSSVAVDAEGNLFVADSTNRRIRKVTTATSNPGEPAVISALYPRSGSTLGGSRIRILGRKFHAGSIVRLGGVALSALIFKSAGEMVGLTPPQAAGTYSLEVVQPDDTTTLLANAFTYLQLNKVAPRTPTASQPPVWRIPFVVDSPEFRTNLGINNTGGVMAAVQISLVDHHGLLLAQASTTVPPFGMQQINHITRYLESASTVTGREGYLILESNQDIRAWASQIDNLSADPSFVLARSDAASRVLLPSSVSNDRFSTSLTVINTSAIDGQVSLRLRDSAGVLLASLPDHPIEGYGYLYFDDIHKAAELSKTFGPIEVEAHGGIHVIATAHIVSNERTGAYLEAVDVSTTGRSLVLYSLENAEFRTNLGINNAGAATANVTIRLVGRDGVPLGSLTTTVPPGGMTQLNRINVRLGSASPGVSLEGTLWLEADQDIVAWTSQIDNLTEDPSLVVSKSLHATKLLIPSTTSVSGFKSHLVVANLDATPTTVELKLRAVDGNLKASRVEIIPGNGL